MTQPAGKKWAGACYSEGSTSGAARLTAWPGNLGWTHPGAYPRDVAPRARRPLEMRSRHEPGQTTVPRGQRALRVSSSTEGEDTDARHSPPRRRQSRSSSLAKRPLLVGGVHADPRRLAAGTRAPVAQDGGRVRSPAPARRDLRDSMPAATRSNCRCGLRRPCGPHNAKLELCATPGSQAPGLSARLEPCATPVSSPAPRNS